MKNTKKGRAAHLKDAEKRTAALERELAELKPKAEKLEYELGRYKYGVASREKMLADLRGDLELARQKEKANEALVAVLLCRMGADEKHPVVVEHKAVGEALNGYRVLIRLDEEEQTYSLFFVME